MNNEKSLFEQLGGKNAMNAVVELFYRKVLADDRICHFFSGTDMEALRAKQKAFLTFAFGGPNRYSGKGIRSAHAHMDLNEEHFNAVLEALASTLKELKVSEELIAQAASVALSVKDEILNR